MALTRWNQTGAREHVPAPGSRAAPLHPPPPDRAPRRTRAAAAAARRAPRLAATAVARRAWRAAIEGQRSGPQGEGLAPHHADIVCVGSQCVCAVVPVARHTIAFAAPGGSPVPQEGARLRVGAQHVPRRRVEPGSEGSATRPAPPAPPPPPRRVEERLAATSFAAVRLRHAQPQLPPIRLLLSCHQRRHSSGRTAAAAGSRARAPRGSTSAGHAFAGESVKTTGARPAATARTTAAAARSICPCRRRPRTLAAAPFAPRDRPTPTPPREDEPADRRPGLAPPLGRLRGTSGAGVRPRGRASRGRPPSPWPTRWGGVRPCRERTQAANGVVKRRCGGLLPAGEWDQFPLFASLAR